MSHPDLPSTGGEGSVVVPAQRDAVVGMSRSTAGVLVHVMDLAPGRGHMAAGDEAFTVAESDRPTLMGVEDAVRGVDSDDAPSRVEQDPLHAAPARGVRGDSGGHGVSIPSMRAHPEPVA